MMAMLCAAVFVFENLQTMDVSVSYQDQKSMLCSGNIFPTRFIIESVRVRRRA